MSASGGISGGISTQAKTPLAGFALQNGTSDILTWTTPNDGNLHTVDVAGVLVVSLLEVGGLIRLLYTLGGNQIAQTLWAGGSAVGNYYSAFAGAVTCDPNTTQRLQQNTALTSGSASLFATILGQ